VFGIDIKMCEVNTVESVLSTDTLPTAQLFSSYIPATPPQFDLDTAFLAFSSHISVLQSSKSLSNLENTLFLLSKSLLKYPYWRDPSLRPLVTVHPYVVLASHRNTLDMSLAAEAEIRRIIRNEPLVAQRYLWTMRAIGFLSDLAVVWGLVDSKDFAHRGNLRSTMVPSSQLQDCQKLDSLCLLPEVLYAATAPETVFQAIVPESLCSAVNTAFVHCLQLLVGLNREVDFGRNGQINDYLFRSGRVSPEVVNAKEKRAIALKVGFHVLTLPVWWRRWCFRRANETTNQQLKTSLSTLYAKHLELERFLAHMKAEN